MKKTFTEQIKDWDIKRLKRAQSQYEDARLLAAREGRISDADKAGVFIADIGAEIERRATSHTDW